MASQVFERGLQSWINVAEASEFDGPARAQSSWKGEALGGGGGRWSRKRRKQEKAVVIDRALCASNATTSTEEASWKQFDLGDEVQRNVSRKRETTRPSLDCIEIGGTSLVLQQLIPSRSLMILGGSKEINTTGRSTSAGYLVRCTGAKARAVCRTVLEVQKIN